MISSIHAYINRQESTVNEPYISAQVAREVNRPAPKNVQKQQVTAREHSSRHTHRQDAGNSV